MDEKTYTIDDLCDLTGFSRRTIRYYVQEGIIGPPAGRGRGGFYYDSHLQKLLQIKSLQERGLGLTAIMNMLKAGETEPISYYREVWVKYQVIPGLEIAVSRDLEQQENKKIVEIIKIARTLFEEKKE